MELYSKYTVSYEGIIFVEDTEGLNTFNTNSWKEAIEMYYNYPNANVSIHDNEYGVTFSNGDWY